MNDNIVEWSPEASIVLTGREFEAFSRLVALYEIPMTELSPKDIQSLFGPALEANRNILKRMLDTGLARTTGESETKDNPNSDPEALQPSIIPAGDA